MTLGDENIAGNHFQNDTKELNITSNSSEFSNSSSLQKSPPLSHNVSALQIETSSSPPKTSSKKSSPLKNTKKDGIYVGKQVFLTKGGGTKNRTPPSFSDNSNEKKQCISPVWGEVENKINFFSPQVDSLLKLKLPPMISPINDENHYPPLTKSTESNFLSSTKLESPKNISMNRKNETSPCAKDDNIISSDTSLINLDELNGENEEKGNTTMEDKGEGKFFVWDKYTSS